MQYICLMINFMMLNKTITHNFEKGSNKELFVFVHQNEYCLLQNKIVHILNFCTVNLVITKHLDWFRSQILLLLDLDTALFLFI